MMKAIVCTKYGSPEVLELRKDVAKPIPSDGEVLIKIHATSVTASDALIRGLNDKQKNSFFLRILLQIIFGFLKPRNPILGMTLSGEIEDTGTGVTIFKKGDKVFAYGDKRFGSYAEYICLHESFNVLPKPTNITHKEAACVSYGGLLAMHCIKKANIHQPGRKVLIYGASGSIGTMAVQLAAKEKGAVVTAVCSKRNFELVESLGAVKMIDYTQAQQEEKKKKGDDPISQLLESEVYDYVIDAVGDSKTSELKEALKKKYRKAGKYISIDDDLPSTKKEDFMKLRELVEKGILSPVIDKCFDLEEMVDAHKYVDHGHKRGNVAILVTDKANDK